MHVALESLDGGGKTTHIARLNEELQGLGLRTVVIANPGKGTFSGSALRSHIAKLPPERANQLFAYDIVRSERSIPPNTDVVIWDRHLDSVRVSNTDPESADIQLSAIRSKITPPDRKIYLDIPPEVSWDRESKTSTHPIDPEWIRAKHNRYKRIIEQAPEKFTIIDATQPLDVVYQAILGILQQDLEKTIEERRGIYDLFINTPGLIKFVLNAPVEVKPSVYLPMFVNVKATMGDVVARTKITDEMVKIARQSRYDSVIGLESGGSYYAVAIANELGLPVAFHRTKSKTYSGATGDIVGIPPERGSNVLIVDDVYATGQSASRASQRLSELGCTHDLVTAYSYSADDEVTHRLGGVRATSVTYFKGIRQTAVNSGLLTADEANRLTEMVDCYRNTRYA